MRILNAHQNNLRNLSLTIPENRLIVVTGLSGSGKSSLAMEVIANEGYRYFLESLPAYNQQHGVVIPTAEVDEIRELPPVIKVEQSKRFRSVNATFGTLSDLAMIFRILFARYSGENPISRSLFSFNHPKGACTCCNGIGRSEFIDLDKLVANPDKTLREGAIATTLPNGYIVYSQVTVDELNKVCKAHGFHVDMPWKDLNAEQRDVILNGSDRIKVFYGKHSIESRLKWKGLKAKPREEGYYKGMLPIMKDILKRDRNPNILKFVSSRKCPECKGARIKAAHLSYRWQGLNFCEWMTLPLGELYGRLKSLDVEGGEQKLVNKMEVQLYDMLHLGMEAYTLGTPSNELSSGDAQRLKLIRQVNSSLQGILYVFDEPSIGLPDSSRTYLQHIFNRLITNGNTVMVVEHDLQLIREADWIIELGPGAGVNGGEIIFNGPAREFLQTQGLSSATLAEMRVEHPAPSLNKQIKPPGEMNFTFGALSGVSRKTPEIIDWVTSHAKRNKLKTLTVSDQPIGKTPRSNPATYTGIADNIRDLLAKTPEAKSLALGKSAFSFNNKTGRCDTCEGAGVISLSMSVMGTINQTCPSCNGKRFKPEVLQVRWNGKNISSIYDLSISDAITFFEEEKSLVKILALMIQLGLGYITLGQPSNTLSGGEAQRIKLTRHFAKSTKNTILLLEEPTIGLHYQNVRELLEALQQLKKQTAGIICFDSHPLWKTYCDRFLDNTLKRKGSAIPSLDRPSTNNIVLRGVRTHHLKELSLEIPRNKLSVVTGISGAGKSSLVIDTLHGYGLQEMTKQFSSYEQSRVGVNFQFAVDQIGGLTPTICITRKENNFSERSDIAVQTGIDKVLRFAFSRKARYMGEELSASHFSQNHELGKCEVCDGFGAELLPDVSRMVLDEEKSIAEGLLDHNKALAYYGHPGSQYMAIAGAVGKEHGFDLETPFCELSPSQKEVLLYGTGAKEWTTTWHFKTKTRTGEQEVRMPWIGIFNLLKEEYHKTRKNKNTENLTALFTPVPCKHCQGSGLKPERLEIRIAGKSIFDLRTMDFISLQAWFENEEAPNDIDDKLREHIKPRLIHTIKRAKQLHIDHLQLSRRASTLSGGERQRVALITQLNSPLKGITYLLDEPSAGLSGDNIPDLIRILKELIAKENTVVVIEHNKDILLSADHMIELGPGAGVLGGNITYQGTPERYLAQGQCHPYFKVSGRDMALRSTGKGIRIHNLSRRTLKQEVLDIPVGGLTAIYGKSGVGKTTLVKEVLIPSLESQRPMHCDAIAFPKEYSGAYYFEPKKLRSHANTLLVTYLDLMKVVAKIFSRETGLKPRDFSYKNKSSQCEQCKGEGYAEIALDVTANVVEVCDKCNGQRYTSDILNYNVGGLTIAEVLSLSVLELKNWLNDLNVPKAVIDRLVQLEEIGLGHLCVAQPVRTLSSGEKQRLLLLNWIQQADKNALYILDEPSVGLHYSDIDLLYAILEKLGKTNDVLIIDHNPYLLGKIGVGICIG